ncbi:MAG: hypothetical protein Q9172_002697 [Xanthocarpia lactea]
MTEPKAPVFDRLQHRRNEDSANVLRNQGKHRQAAILLRQKLAMSEQYFSERDLTVLSDRDSLSDCWRELGYYVRAIKLDRATLSIRQTLDLEGEDTIATLQSLADNLSQIRKNSEAIPFYRSALATRLKTLGRKHNDTLETQHNLASSLYESGQAKEASQLNAQVLKIREERLVADDDDLVATRHNLATNHYALGDLRLAEELTEQNLLALQSNRALNDAQLLAICGLQDRIKATIREATRSQAINMNRQAEPVQDKEPVGVSDKQVRSRAQAPEIQAGPDTLRTKRKVPKPLEGVTQTQPEGDVSKIESTAKARSDTYRDKNPERRAKSPITQNDSQECHPTQKGEFSKIESTAKARSDANRDKSPKRRVKSPITQNDTQECHPTQKGEVSDTIRDKNPKRRVKSPIPQNHTHECRPTQKGEVSNEKLDARGIGTKADVNAGAGYLTTPPAILKPSLSCPDQTKKITKDVQQSQDKNVNLPVSGPRGEKPAKERQKTISRSLSDSKSKVDRPKILQTVSDKQSGTKNAPNTSSASRETTMDGPQSSQERTTSRSESRTLNVPIADKSRSRSVGALSDLQNTTQPSLQAFTSVCDARDGEGEGKLFDYTSGSSRPTWFDRFQQTQSLVAQSRKARGSRIRVAILDTGIDLGHAYFTSSPDAAGAVDQQQSSPRRHRVKECRSFVGEAPGDRDSVGHGTHCASLLLELSPNADIYVARVCEKERNQLDPAVVAKAIMHSTDQWKVAIITLSLGWPQYQKAVEDAIKYATMNNILICAAASNDGANDGIAFPANSHHVICVHSANEKGKPSDFTPNPLPYEPNFAVLGENVRAAWPAREHGKSQTGTSVATPILAAVMALILEFVDQKPRKTPEEKRLLLREYSPMTNVLVAMSDEAEGYRYVRPWKLMSSNVSRERVEARIQDAIGL